MVWYSSGFVSPDGPHTIITPLLSIGPIELVLSLVRFPKNENQKTRHHRMQNTKQTKPRRTHSFALTRHVGVVPGNLGRYSTLRKEKMIRAITFVVSFLVVLSLLLLPGSTAFAPVYSGSTGVQQGKRGGNPVLSKVMSAESNSKQIVS
jgi:hypothetical protein